MEDRTGLSTQKQRMPDKSIQTLRPCVETRYRKLRRCVETQKRGRNNQVKMELSRGLRRRWKA
jgi:hypothetical protein